MGKSALVANIAENAVLAGHAVALFSLEMSESELAQRFVASQARIKGEDLRRGKVAESRWPKILEACQRLAEAPLFVDDSSDTGVLEIRAKCRRLHAQVEGGLGLVIVDYLQLMRAEGRIESRVEQVSQMSRGLKGLARELGVPVIALSQLSRAVEQRGGEKKPVLSDLRESGAIEQDADLVMFIYREEYYEKESERPGEADIIIAKHRNGPVGRRGAHLPEGIPKVHELRRGAVRAVSDLCPFDLCDGSGFRVEAATNTAYDCRCRAQRVARAKARNLSAVIPRRYRDVAFERPPVTDIDPQIVSATRRFAADIEDQLDAGRGLWFMGPVGTGKTTLAMLVSKAASDAGRSVAIYSLPRLLNEIRDTHRAERSHVDLLDRLTAVDLLHIDDVGAERTTDWVLEELYSIVNSRYEDKRSIVITTNILDRDALCEQITARTVSRLTEMCDELPLLGHDHRMDHTAA